MSPEILLFRDKFFACWPKDCPRGLDVITPGQIVFEGHTARGAYRKPRFPFGLALVASAPSQPAPDFAHVCVSRFDDGGCDGTKLGCAVQASLVEAETEHVV
jgi:hypothetical protein